MRITARTRSCASFIDSPFAVCTITASIMPGCGLSSLRIGERHGAIELACDAFEEKVREFERCATCKAIAYCSRSCQRKDWADHRNVCKAGLVFGGYHECRYG